MAWVWLRLSLLLVLMAGFSSFPPSTKLTFQIPIGLGNSQISTTKFHYYYCHCKNEILNPGLYSHENSDVEELLALSF